MSSAFERRRPLPSLNKANEQPLQSNATVIDVEYNPGKTSAGREDSVSPGAAALMSACTECVSAN